jgi:SAM-dependent methyltransferase
MREREAKPKDSSCSEFWDARYAAGETPWDFHGVPAALKIFLKTSQAGRVLIPGCGAGYEVRAFHEAGCKVTGIDFSVVAIERARAELGALAGRIVQSDFFTHDFGSRPFDVIYERTFLCALPPDLWTAYVNRMAHLLRRGGKLVGIFLYGEQAEPPPYPLTQEKARELFKEKFSLVKGLPVSDSLPLFAGNERWHESALIKASMFAIAHCQSNDRKQSKPLKQIKRHRLKFAQHPQA